VQRGGPGRHGATARIEPWRPALPQVWCSWDRDPQRQGGDAPRRFIKTVVGHRGFTSLNAAAEVARCGTDSGGRALASLAAVVVPANAGHAAHRLRARPPSRCAWPPSKDPAPGAETGRAIRLASVVDGAALCGSRRWEVRRPAGQASCVAAAGMTDRAVFELRSRHRRPPFECIPDPRRRAGRRHLLGGCSRR
jgi:hypothetical protein